jgi:hypothetical protein
MPAVLAFRRAVFSTLIAGFFYAPNPAFSQSAAERLQQQLTVTCQRWEAAAANARSPSPETLARYEKLTADKQRYMSEASRYPSGSVERQRAIENAAQTSVEAAGLLDWQQKQRAADDCWSELGDTKERHDALARRRAESLAEPMPAPPAYTRPPAVNYQLPSPSIPSPSPMPVTRALSYEEVPKPQTWRDTPCAPAIPPILLDMPTSYMHPLIPPACR